MAERGLHASIWASATNGDVRYGPWPGDWDCPACGFSNYQRRTECFRCSHKGLKEVSANGYAPPNTTPKPPLNTKIPKEGGGWDEASRARSGGSSWQKENSTWNASQVSSGERGLAMSRWAPRNYNGRAKAADKSEVWTRVCLVLPSSILWLTL
jgi:hypothetical protein